MMTPDPAAETAEPPEPIARVTLAVAVALIAGGLSRGDRVMAITGEETRAAIEAVMRTLPSERVRVILINNPGRGPVLLAGLVAAIAETGSVAPDTPVYERACEILSERAGAEDRVLLVIDDADTLEASALSFLGVAISTFDPGGPLVQILLIGRPELWSILERPGSFGLTELLGVRVALEPPAAGWFTSPSRQYSDPTRARAQARADLDLTRRRKLIEYGASVPADVAFPFVPAPPSRLRRTLIVGGGTVTAAAVFGLFFAMLHGDQPGANRATTPIVARAPADQAIPLPDGSGPKTPTTSLGESVPPPATIAAPDLATPARATGTATDGPARAATAIPPARPAGSPATVAPTTRAGKPDEQRSPGTRSVDGLKSDFDAYVAAHQPRAAALPGNSREALFQEFLAWRNHLGASPPPQADPAISKGTETTLSSKRVVILYRGRADKPSLDAARVAALVAPRARWVETRAVRRVPKAATIRFLYPEDEASAADLAAALGATGLDWTVRGPGGPFRHKLPPGTIEILLPIESSSGQ